jgi:TonB family protein
MVTAKAHQPNKPVNTPSGQTQNTLQETKPEPPGGMEVFNKYMRKYTDRDYNNADAGTVTVSFVVEKDGSLSGYKITHSLNKEADGIAIDVLKDYKQKWKPATLNGQPVSAPFNLDIHFGK